MPRRDGRELEELWSAALDRVSFGRRARPRCFRVRRPEITRPQLCITFDEYVAVLDGSRLVDSGERRMVAAPPEGDGVSKGYFEAEGSRVRRFVDGSQHWEVDVARRKFGLGLGRDKFDDLEWDSDFVGRYREPIEVVSLHCLPSKKNDMNDRVAVVTSNARLIVLDAGGDKVWSTWLRRGRVESVGWFPQGGSDAEPEEYVLSVKYRQLRKRFFWSSYSEDYIFVLAGQRMRMGKVGPELVCALKEAPGSFLDDDFNMVAVGREDIAVRQRTSGLSARRTSQLTCIAVDPWDPSRAMLLVGDPNRQRLIAQTVDGKDLWEHELPPAGCDRYNVSGALGPAGSAGEEFVAVSFVTERHLADVNADVYQRHLRVLRMDGTLVAAKEFQPSGDSMRGDNQLLCIDRPPSTSEPLLITIDSDAVHVFRIPMGPGAVREAGDLPEQVAQLPEFPMPAEDPWSADWLTLPGEKPPAAGGGAS